MLVTRIAVIPGFGEGRWHTRRLVKALENLGYTSTRDAEAADVIITHSAGCFFLPNTSHSKQIILIDPPYWPERSNFICYLYKVVQDMRTNIHRKSIGYLLAKTAWNWVYVIAYVVRMISIVRLARGQDFHEALAHKQVAIVRNHQDTWLTPQFEELLPREKEFSYFRLPGEHDDCWFTTTEHAALIHTILQKQAE